MTSRKILVGAAAALACLSSGAMAQSGVSGVSGVSGGLGIDFAAASVPQGNNRDYRRKEQERFMSMPDALEAAFGGEPPAAPAKAPAAAASQPAEASK
jgi:hypothetical protein